LFVSRRREGIEEITKHRRKEEKEEKKKKKKREEVNVPV